MPTITNWFHDTGYLTDRTDHEAKSAALATAFLKEHEAADEVIEKVTGCILATKMPQQPVGLLQQILCDADLYHLGTNEFSDKSKLLHKEMETIKHIEISKQDWREKNITFLEGHHYFTDYAQLLLTEEQDKNLEKLKNKEKEKAAAEDRHEEKEKTTDDVEKSAKKQKVEKPDKGIETMFRITSGNNQRLSDMADRKAHILITVNSIILSAIISLVLKKLDTNAFLAIPSFILLGVSLACMIFSILATRPSIPAGVFTQDDVDQKKVNLLFFGNFYKMSLDKYADGMEKVMNDKAFLYSMLVKDVYSQGVVLGRKYRLLRLSYNIFMYGLVVAVLAFVLSSVIHDQTPVIVH